MKTIIWAPAGAAIASLMLWVVIPGAALGARCGPNQDWNGTACQPKSLIGTIVGG